MQPGGGLEIINYEVEMDELPFEDDKPVAPVPLSLIMIISHIK